MASTAAAQIASVHGVQATDESLSATLSAFGDALRSGDLRNALGESELPAICVEALADPHTATPALRVLANLCIDHGM